MQIGEAYFLSSLLFHEEILFHTQEILDSIMQA